VYQRYEGVGASTAGATNGIAAIVFRGNWGKIGEVMTFESANAATKALGNGGATGTVDGITELFNGGATTVLAVRLGSGGTNATATLKDGSADAITLTAKCVGSRAFSYMVRELLGDSTTKEFVLIEGGTVREKIAFLAGDGEVDALVKAINDNSAYFGAEKVVGYSGSGKVSVIAETAITAGTDPTVTNESYSEAFVALEAYRWNAICVDTDETAVHALVAAYMNRIYQQGHMGFAVVGEPTTVAYADRVTHAAAFNDYNVIYVGGGWEDSTGAKYEGRKAVARITGMVAAVPANESLTHKVITGAVKPLEMLTNSQLENAIKNGMMAFSVSSAGTVWIDCGITTLVVPDANDDEGWKKIKRAKIRFEVMTRISDSIEPLIGKVNNDADGRSNIMKLAQDVLNAMVAERKLFADPEPYVKLDADNPATGDSAWFVVGADDIDSTEKSYFVYKFRYAVNEA
jgi:hypothetical protein